MAASVMPVQMCGRHAKCQTVIENTVQIFDIQIVLIHRISRKKAGRRHLIRIPYNHCIFTSCKGTDCFTGRKLRCFVKYHNIKQIIFCL